MADGENEARLKKHVSQMGVRCVVLSFSFMWAAFRPLHADKKASFSSAHMGFSPCVPGELYIHPRGKIQVRRVVCMHLVIVSGFPPGAPGGVNNNNLRG